MIGGPDSIAKLRPLPRSIIRTYAQCHDIGHEDDIDHLVMEYVEGQTLRERLECASLGLDEARNVAIEIRAAPAGASVIDPP